MSKITLEYPPSWLAAMGVDAPQFAADTKIAAAMKLFERHRLSSGQAAQLAGMARVEFLLTCRQWGVSSVDWDDEDLAAEFSGTRPVVPA